MQYLLIVWTDPDAPAVETAEDQLGLDQASLASDADLRRSGHFIAASALQPASSAVTVRVRDGRMSATTGPFAEAAEAIGGFVFIDANDLNDAIRIAGEIPVARYAAIEVRPALDLPGRVRDRQAALGRG